MGLDFEGARLRNTGHKNGQAKVHLLWSTLQEHGFNALARTLGYGQIC